MAEITTKEIIEIVIEVSASITTMIAVLVGVWQFKKTQKFEIIAKFKDIQTKKYTETTEVISNIVYRDNFDNDEFKEKLNRFWQLYWVELSAVENHEVEINMVKLGRHLNELKEKNFINISKSEKEILKKLGLNVAHAIKKSSKDWKIHE